MAIDYPIEGGTPAGPVTIEGAVRAAHSHQIRASTLLEFSDRIARLVSTLAPSGDLPPGPAKEALQLAQMKAYTAVLAWAEAERRRAAMQADIDENGVRIGT